MENHNMFKKSFLESESPAVMIPMKMKMKQLLSTFVIIIIPLRISSNNKRKK